MVLSRCLTTRKGVVVGLCLTFMYGGVAFADERIFDFDIPGQRSDDALILLGKQADVTVLFQYDLATKYDANRLQGEFTLPQAVEILLANSGLKAEFGEQGHLFISIDEGGEQMSQLAYGQTRNRKAGLGALLAAVFSVGASAQDNGDDAEFEEIVVTGSNIRGVEAVGVDVITLDREYIELSGIPTTTELIQSVPQNFGLGSEAFATVGVINNTGFNFAFSPSVNLRGLGTDSTLVLIDGRRPARGGSAGNFIDANIVPTAAIERIDVLPDGASAIYGSDAIGGVVNVILRRDYEGAETSVRYAPGTSDIDELQFSQVFGKNWNTGNMLFSYEYYDRSALQAADRKYTRDSDLTSLGGGNNSIPESNPGNILDPNTFLPGFAIPAGQDGTALTPADLIDLTVNPGAINLQNKRVGSYILPEQTRHSALVSARQTLSDNIDLFAEARYSRRDSEFLTRNFGSFLEVPDSNAFFVDPFGGSTALFLLYNFADDFGPPRMTGDLEALSGVLGANFKLSDSWEVEVHSTYAIEDTFNLFDRIANLPLLDIALADFDPATAFNPFGDGSNTNPATLAAIKGFIENDIESELTTVNARVAGDLFSMSGGGAKLALGAQFRNESLFSNETNFLDSAVPAPGFAPLIFDLDRDISAAFAEIYLPIVSDRNRRPGIEKLVVSIAGRYEDYSDFGDTVDPKLGLAWSPVASLGIRGTVGTSFRAPLLTELNTGNNSLRTRNRTDPAAPTGRTLALTLTGNSPDLVPQEGTTWTVGFDVTPKSLAGFELGLTYFDTSVDNLIQLPLAIPGTVFLDPVTNAPIIRRVDPANNSDDLADVTALLNDPACTHSTCATPPDQIAAIVDGRVQNIAKAELSGLDLNLSYAFERVAGAFHLSFYASHLFEFREQLLNGPLVDKIDTIAKPNSTNVRSSLSWTWRGMNAAVIGKHIGDYVNNLGSAACQISACPVSSWTTWDLQFGYDFSDRFSGMLDGTRLSLSIGNVFDTDPPFVDIAEDGVGFDAVNADPMGRFAALKLTKAW